MGKQTGVILVAFLALHVALVLQIVSVATSKWEDGTLNSSWADASTANSTNKGLWEACEEDHCTPVNKTLQSDWFEATQALAVIGTGGTMAAAVMYYIFLFVTGFKSSFSFHAVTTLIQLLSVVVFVVALALFGANALDDTTDFGDNYEFEFAWSYYLGVAGVGVAFVALLASARESCLLRHERPGYENI